MKYASKIILCCLCLAFLAACSDKAVYTTESFAADSPFRMKVDDDVATACESARRSLLGQGYLIESADSEKVKGRKAYKSEGNLNNEIGLPLTLLQLNESHQRAVLEMGMYALGEIQPKISRHLAILRDQHIVSDRRVGQWVYYRIDPDLPDWAHEILRTTVARAASDTRCLQDIDALKHMPERPDAVRCA